MSQRERKVSESPESCCFTFLRLVFVEDLCCGPVRNSPLPPQSGVGLGEGVRPEGPLGDGLLIPFAVSDWGREVGLVGGYPYLEAHSPSAEGRGLVSRQIDFKVRLTNTKLDIK